MGTTIFAFATVGAGLGFTSAAVAATVDSVETYRRTGDAGQALDTFGDYGPAATVSTAIGGAIGAAAGYSAYKSQNPKTPVPKEEQTKAPVEESTKTKIPKSTDNKGNVTETGRAANKSKPDPNAEGAHSTYKRDPKTGEITNYRTWEPNSKNPSGFDEIKGYDGIGRYHMDVTGENLMPHIHDRSILGGVRRPEWWEIPLSK